MAYQQNDNSGSVFQNEKKATDKHPDRSGQAMIDGIEYWVSGWLKKTKDGKPYLSLAFKRKGEAKPQPTTSKMQPRGSMKDELDDEVPF